jgi:hypothetical protein
MGLLLIWAIAQLVESYHGSHGSTVASGPRHPGRSPKDVALADVSLRFKWTPVGFEDLKLADLIVENSGPYPVREIKVVCQNRDRKGVRARGDSRTLHETVKPHSSRTFKEFSVGFLRGPDDAASCKIADLVAEHPLPARSKSATREQRAVDLSWDRVRGWLARVMGE